MKVCYKKLWKILIDKGLKKKDLMSMAGISNYTINRLTNDANVNSKTLAKICNALHCGFDDIMDAIAE